MGTRARIRAALVVVALAACAEGAEPGAGPGGDAAVVDASSPDETSDGGSSRPPDAAPDPIDGGPPDAALASTCDPDNPCAAGQCCHFFVCVAGTQTEVLCIVEPSVPTCSEAMPCGAGQCCHFNRCIPGTSLAGVCVPRTE